MKFEILFHNKRNKIYCIELGFYVHFKVKVKEKENRFVNNKKGIKYVKSSMKHLYRRTLSVPDGCSFLKVAEYVARA